MSMGTTATPWYAKKEKHNGLSTFVLLNRNVTDTSIPIF